MRLICAACRRNWRQILRESSSRKRHGDAVVVRSADQALTRCRDSTRAPQPGTQLWLGDLWTGQIKLQTHLRYRWGHGRPILRHTAHGVPIKVVGVARMCAEAIGEGLTSVPVGCVSWPDVHQSAASERPASKALVSSHPSRPGSSRRTSTGVRSRCQAGASEQRLRRGAAALSR